MNVVAYDENWSLPPDDEFLLDISQGQDPEILAAREKMPEPANWTRGDYYESALYTPPVLSREITLATINQVRIQFRRALFRRVLWSHHGAQFWVWRHEETGKIYL